MRIIAAALGLLLMTSLPGASASATSCRVWEIIPTPISQSSEIFSIDGTSSSDLWAGAEGAPNTTLLHWNGAGWDVPPTGGVVGNVLGVDALAFDDVWAVGSLVNARREVALHWDGSRWHTVLLPEVTDGLTLYGVSGTGPSDVWAVGYRGVYAGGILAHWNGTEWSLVSQPVEKAEFRAVRAVSTTDVWAVGGAPAAASNERSLVEHWDGVTWTSVPLPDPHHKGLLLGLGSSGPADVWAVGQTLNQESLIYRWDGVAWKRLAQAPYAMTGRIRGVSVVAPDDVWVAGVKNGGGPPIAAHWDGARWSLTSVANKENGWLDTVKAFDATDVWVGGFAVDRPDSLVARFVGCR